MNTVYDIRDVNNTNLYPGKDPGLSPTSIVLSECFPSCSRSLLTLKITWFFLPECEAGHLPPFSARPRMCKAILLTLSGAVRG